MAGKSVGEGGKSPRASWSGGCAWPVIAGKDACTWLALGWLKERINATRSSTRADIGRSSPMRMPSTLVAIAPNSPRAGEGASGLGSQVSCCAWPPCR